MKFCPYCGASLPGSAASFCPECGKSLPAGRPVGVRRQKKRPPQEKSPKAPQRRPRPIDPMDVSGVDLYSYAEFDAIDRDDRYRMMDISARGSNRDGAALRYVAEQLSRRSEDVKLLMLVSDGQPADTDYYGTAAEEDLRGVKQEYQRKGILFVAAAIGSDKENIERIYGDSFLDISDLTKLPVKLAGIIKRFIRV